MINSEEVKKNFTHSMKASVPIYWLPKPFMSKQEPYLLLGYQTYKCGVTTQKLWDVHKVWKHR